MKLYLEALGIIFRITFTIVLFITLPLVVFTLVTSKTPLIAGIQSFVVLTGSMTPTYPVGSIIYTVPQKTYQINDVITFKEGNVNVTHRIVDVKPEGYITKGDANNVIDSKVVVDNQIIGKRAFSVMNAGKAILFMKTIQGFILMLVLPTLLLVSFEFWNIKKEWEKSIRKKLLKQLQLERDLNMFKSAGERIQNNQYSL